MSNTQPVQYMDRTRRYYEAQGFDRAYQWAQCDDVPFTSLAKPLSESRLVVITTGARYDRQQSDPRYVDSGDIQDLPERLFADDLAWDKDATHMEDLNSYLPIKPLQTLVTTGVLGDLAPRFHCLPTEYSQRRTREADAPEVLKRCREDGADVALLVPL
ncbi:MAG: hypothetical protein F4W90_00650 [Gammaproteobacteria bacterium]|nr:hypothetical protein [Gammaproteobacteria bacterium]